ncbi:nidogen-like domain-containing protein [Ruegeria marina]|uniref:Ca2+-binding protein, RTX toxin-related n=1 Tax=Ruegeria marina TaxID=639004 RepID=A0A1G7CTJ3_9RHOB|nr:nidogen-like domain-containing protein [Ruegeria marina]SDE42682.1 Ca2+-binding protein, RTX toxin-related [Ruegeria marina]
MVQNYTSLLVSNTDGWHDGEGIITYSFIGTEMPNYYPTVDTNADGDADSWDVGQGDLIPFTGQNFSMTVEQRAMTSLAIQAWNEVANVNLQPGTIDPDDPANPNPLHGTPITGNGTLQPVGGNPLPRNDDGSSLQDFSAVFEDGLNFFGQHYDASQIWVNTNGNITFNGNLSQYTPSGISAGTRALIAPFWADVDTGDSVDTPGNPILVNVDPNADVVTITWENVAFYNENDNALNSFQLQLFDRGNGDFDIVFRYEDINWTSGQASGSNDQGLGGTPARAGFSAGNGQDFFELPQSGSESAILNLENTVGNTGVTGMWVFEVRNGAVAGDIAFGATNFPDTGLYGFVSDFPEPDDLGETPSPHGDMWINSNNPNQFVPGVGPIYGHTSWNTYLHELGHALGLRHPNEAPNDPATNNQFTVMSYVPHPSVAGEALLDQAFSLTPMVWDIQALQELYGANTTTRTGDTAYFGDGVLPTESSHHEAAYQYGTNNMMVTGEDNRDRPVILTIWDAGGNDTIDGSDLSTNSNINLAPGSYSTIGSIANNIGIAAAVTVGGQVINLVENAWGGSGNDTIAGNWVANELLGFAGNDRLSGLAGNDTLDGGAGDDTLLGGAGGDQMFGGAGNDSLNGEAGGDRFLLELGMGHDTVFDYIAGEDQLDYSRLGQTEIAAITEANVNGNRVITLSDGSTLTLVGQGINQAPTGAPVISGTPQTGQVLTALTGSIQDANGLGNFVYTWLRDGVAIPGANAMTYTLLAADIGARISVLVNYVDGGGTPEALASVQTVPVIETPATPGTSGGDTQTVPQGEVGNLEGGDGNDTQYGGGGNDTLSGGEGDDLMGGGAGDDTLNGGGGNDQGYGGPGNDTAEGGFGSDTLGGFTGNDSLTGGGGNDQLWGAAGDDTLDGGLGNDTLGGADGNDSANGGDGNDEVWGSHGNDTLLGGNGQDTLGGFTGNDSLLGEGDNDEMWGAAGNDTLDGGEGDDSIGAGADDDLASGGAGNDQVFGGLGNDTLFGNEGNDTIYGAAGNDVIDGGEGDDEMFAGPGADVIIMSAGNDTLNFFSGTEDRIDLSFATTIVNFTDLVDPLGGHTTESGGNLIIDDLNGNTLTLVGIQLADIDSFDFIF